jgi:hypothetical protein
MSYEKKSLRLLGGSLSLLSPGDKVSAEDGIQMQNWRADQSGSLRSRGGTTIVGEISGVSLIHSIAQRGNVFYFGADTSLFRGLSSSTPIATGFDGNLLGMVPMNGYMWCLNQGANGKDDGSTFSEWQIAAPTVAPTLNGFTAAAADVTQFFAPNGTYTFYYTYYDDNGNESAPSPASAAITTPDTLGDDITINCACSSDPTVVGINLYAEGGSLGDIYQVATLPYNVPGQVAQLADQMSDADAETLGIIMQLDFDPPPPASVLVGPYFSRLLAACSIEHPNRMWWTKPDQPGYWPGSLDGDNNTAQWVDIGDDGEKIVWITVHPRTAVIYKERTVWILFGDPDTGTLQQAHATVGLRGPRAVANAGDSDYFLGTDGAIHKFDLTTVSNASSNVQPLLQGLFIQQGLDDSATMPGPINPYGSSDAAMAFGNGQVLCSYLEQTAEFPNGGNSNTLVLNQATGKWYSLRVQSNISEEADGINEGFNELYYAGPDMWACMGNAVIDLAQDDTTWDFNHATLIHLVYQSPFLDCSEPDNTKVILEVVIDAQMNPTGGPDALTVFMHYDNGSRVGETLTTSLTCVGRAKLKIAMPQDTDLPGRRCTNFSIEISCEAENELFLHSVYVYYYVEPRMSLVASSMPAYLAGGKLVQTKELQIQIDSTQGPVVATWSSDFPENALTVQDRSTIPTSSGQRNFQLPFLSIVEGRLFQLTLSASAGPFILYDAKVLARVIGVLVEAYEAAGGFIWDSQEHTFESGLTHIPRTLGIALYANPIKQARELEIQLDNLGPVTVTLMSDLPNNEIVPRFTTTIPAGTGWHVAKIPLPNALGTAQIEGRIWRLQLAGASQYKLFNIGLEILPIGVYIEAYEATGGAVWDSRPMDFGSPLAKEARELELDIDTADAVVTLLSDLPSLKMAPCFTTGITTSGRQRVPLQLPNVGLTGFPDGRLFELAISGVDAFKLYGARIKMRVYGCYVTVDESAGGALWDSTPLDLATQKAKQFRQLEFDLQTAGPVTITLYLDLFGNTLAPGMSQAAQLTIDTSAQGRRKVQMPLTPPSSSLPAYAFGRLMRVLIGGSASFKLFGARVNYREVGTLVEAYEAAAGAVWDSTPIDLGVARDKIIDQVRFEMESNGAVTITVWTDLPGETLTQRFQQVVSTVGFGRRWVTLEMPAFTQGRLFQVIVSSTLGFRLFQGDVRYRAIGRYLAAGVPDAYRTLSQDFGTERIKLLKRLEVDISADGPLTLTLETNQTGTMSQVYTAAIAQTSGRQTLEFMLPANTRGRLVNLQIGGASSGRLYSARAWTRAVNEPQASWEWQNFPVEDSDALPQTAKLPIEPTAAEFKWAELPVEPTPPQWEWAPFPVAPTDAQWNWVKFLGIDPTSEEWKLIDLPVEQSSQ